LARNKLYPKDEQNQQQCLDRDIEGFHHAGTAVDFLRVDLLYVGDIERLLPLVAEFLDTIRVDDGNDLVSDLFLDPL
jgi:hypothetical protein